MRQIFRPEDPVQGAGGNASKVEDDYPLGAVLEACHLRLWFKIMRIRPGIWFTMPPNGLEYLRPMTYTQNMVVAIQGSM